MPLGFSSTQHSSFGALPLPPDPRLTDARVLAATSTNSSAERRIRRAVPICNVTSFEKEYGFVTLDGGKTQMLAEGSKLAIRRGNDVVAELIISSVELDSAVADVVDFNAEPPQQGDEVIAWPF